jgi:hypothetical protein
VTIFSSGRLPEKIDRTTTVSPLYLCEGDFFKMVFIVQMVPLRVMEDLLAPTKTMAVMRTK